MKRLFDIFLGVFILVITFPFMLLIGLLIRINLGSPVIFKQVRPGFDSNPFVIYKFRTMSNSKDSDGLSLPDAQRVTMLGSFLRSTSLDELPEVWNVIVGDMSFVGPRPLKMDYLALYTEEQARRHEVKPGITGWAQIHGRNKLEWDKRFAYDVWYVENHNILLDVKILFITVAKILTFEGTNPKGGSSVIIPFKGIGDEDSE